MTLEDYILGKTNIVNEELEITEQNSITKIISNLNFTREEELLPEYIKRLDSLWSSFNIPNNLKDAEKYSEIFKEFELLIKEGSNREFRDKKSVIDSLISLHGYDFDDIIKEDQINKVKQFYKELNADIKDITLVELENLKILEFQFLSYFKEIDLTKITKIGQFLKSSGLEDISDENLLEKANEIAKLLSHLGYDDRDCMEQGEIEKIELLLKEYKIENISTLNEDALNQIIYTFSEFDVNFRGITLFDLEEFISDLKQLTIMPVGSAESLEAKIYVIKEFKEKISNLNSQEIIKLTKLIEILELENSSKDKVHTMLNWMQEQGIKCKIKFLNQEGLDKILDLKERIIKITNKEFKNVTAEDIEAITKIYESLSDDRIADIDIAKLEALGKSIANSFEEIASTENYSNAESEVMKAFKIDLFQDSKSQLDEINKLLQDTNVNIWQLSESEAKDLSSTLISYGVQLGEKKLADIDLIDAIKETVLSFKYSSLLEIDGQEVEKIITLVQAYGIEDLKDVNPDIVKKLGIIVDAFDIKLKDIEKDVVENIVEILKATNIKAAESEQGWWSYIAGDSAVLDKISDIKEKIHYFGYQDMPSFDQDEYDKTLKILEELGLSFSKSAVTELKKVGNNFKYFNFQVSETPLYKLKDIVNALKYLGLDVKNITEQEKSAVDHLNKELVTRVFDMPENDIKSLKINVDKYSNISSAKFLADFDKLQSNLKHLGFNDITNINQESTLCIADLESLSNKSSALDKLDSITELVTNFIPKLEELELSECKNLYHYVKVFDFEQGSEEVRALKATMIAEIPGKCSISFEGAIKLTTITKIEEFIASYNKNKECQVTADDADCTEYKIQDFSNIEQITDKICNNYHEDL